MLFPITRASAVAVAEKVACGGLGGGSSTAQPASGAQAARRVPTSRRPVFELDQRVVRPGGVAEGREVGAVEEDFAVAVLVFLPVWVAGGARVEHIDREHFAARAVDQGHAYSMWMPLARTASRMRENVLVGRYPQPAHLFK